MEANLGWEHATRGTFTRPDRSGGRQHHSLVRNGVRSQCPATQSAAPARKLREAVAAANCPAEGNAPSLAKATGRPGAAHRGSTTTARDATLLLLSRSPTALCRAPIGSKLRSRHAFEPQRLHSIRANSRPRSLAAEKSGNPIARVLQLAGNLFQRLPSSRSRRLFRPSAGIAFRTMHSNSTTKPCPEPSFGTGPYRRSPRNRATATSCTRCRVVMRIFRMWSLGQRAEKTWFAFPAGHPWRHRRSPSAFAAVLCRRWCFAMRGWSEPLWLSLPGAAGGVCRNEPFPTGFRTLAVGTSAIAICRALARIPRADCLRQNCAVALPRNSSTRPTRRLRFDRS